MNLDSPDPGLFDKISGFVPPRYRELLVLAALASPYVGRAWKVLASGGGIKGVFRAIWLGSAHGQAPVAVAPTPTPIPTNETKA